MEEEFASYIREELKESISRGSETDMFVLQALLEWYTAGDIHNVVEKYYLSQATLYRKRANVHKCFEQGISYCNRDKKWNKHNKLTKEQEDTVKDIVRKNTPSSVGLHGFTWTGKLLSLYINDNFKVNLQVRACQRLIQNEIIIKEPDAEYYKSIIEDHKRNGYDIWYIKTLSLFIRKKQVPKIKGKVRIINKGFETEGIVLAYNAEYECALNEYFNRTSFKAISEAIYKLITDKISQVSDKILLVVPCQSRYHRIITDLSERETDNIRVIIRPAQIKEEIQLYDMAKEIREAYYKTQTIYKTRIIHITKEDAKTKKKIKIQRTFRVKRNNKDKYSYRSRIGFDQIVKGYRRK